MTDEPTNIPTINALFQLVIQWQSQTPFGIRWIIYFDARIFRAIIVVSRCIHIDGPMYGLPRNSVDALSMCGTRSTATITW